MKTVLHILIGIVLGGISSFVIFSEAYNVDFLTYAGGKSVTTKSELSVFNKSGDNLILPKGTNMKLQQIFHDEGLLCLELSLDERLYEEVNETDVTYLVRDKDK